MKIKLNDPLFGLQQSGLYKIINEVNGNWYIGSTIMGFGKRINRHRGLLRKGKHPNPHLQSAYNKYGESNFSVEIIMISSKKSLLKEEQKILDEHYGKPYCYNISKDSSAPMSGRKHTPETILKQQEASKKRAKEIGECTRKHRLGTKHSKKTIKKMKKSAKIRDDSNRIKVLKSKEYREKMSKTMTGRVFSPEHLKKLRKVFSSQEYRDKMSAIKGGVSQEYRDKMSIIKRGVTHSKKTKANLSKNKFGKQVFFINDKGDIETVISFHDFAKKYNLDRKELSNLAKGKRESYKGWKLYAD